jgi:FKBP-type peptidyl-prolyl cis-trans isomerase SlyD
MNVTKDRVISIDYTLTDEHNNILDSTSGSESFDYLHGFENIIPGLERALEGKKQGDHFSVTLPSADAYGERDERLIIDIPLDRFQDLGPVKKGMQFHTQTPDGVRMITVTNVADQTVTVDGNHLLAGLDLTFDVTVNAIREATAEELEHGHVHTPGHDHAHDCCGGCDSGPAGAEGCGGCRGNC